MLIITSSTVLKREKTVSRGACFPHSPAGGAAVMCSARNEWVSVGGAEITDSGSSRVWTLKERRSGLSQSLPLVHSSWKRPHKQVMVVVMIDWLWRKHESCVDREVQWLWAYMTASTISVLAHYKTILLNSHK